MTAYDWLATHIGIDLPPRAALPGCRSPLINEQRIANFDRIFDVARYFESEPSAWVHELLVGHPDPRSREDIERQLAARLLELVLRRGIARAASHQLVLADEPVPARDAIPDARHGRPTGKLGANPSAPLNCSIFLADIRSFADRRRDDGDRRVVHQALYEILRESFEDSHVPWASCVQEDRGDGVHIVAPATVSTVPLVDPLLPVLAFKLGRHNRRAADRVRIQLRVALHVGPVHETVQGVSGEALIHAARMLDAPVLKQSLASTRADLAVMVSAHVYDTVVRHVPGLVDPAAFRRVRYQVKEADITSWMYLAGAPRNRSYRASTASTGAPAARIDSHLYSKRRRRGYLLVPE